MFYTGRPLVFSRGAWTHMVVRHEDLLRAPAEDVRAKLGAAEAAWLVDEAVAAPDGRALEQIYHHLLCGPLRPLDSDYARRMREAVLHAVQGGLLAVLRFERRRVIVQLAPRPTIGPRPDPQPETSNGWFQVRVVDEVGTALDGIDVVFLFGSERKVVTTNGLGIARVEERPESFTSVTLSSVSAVRDKLKDRWSVPRDPDIPQGDNVSVEQLGSESPTVALDATTPATLVLAPFFRCSELDGVHFAFGKSFLLQSGLGTLTLMADSVVGDDSRKAMIFGHTDTVGAEGLNKELSERRAKVVYAMLTHDTDAWEELWTGSADGTQFKETWGVKETQHILNALGVTDDDGNALDEDGIDGQHTQQAIKRFQRGDYQGAREGRSAVPETGKPDKATRKELLLSYADGVSHDGVPTDRLSKIGSSPFMGCGEFNPLSAHGRDQASRRTVMFVFDRAAEPQGLPCALRDMGPCKGAGGVDDPVPDPPPDGRPYRCKIYREVAKPCPCVPGDELMQLAVQLHDRNLNPQPHLAYKITFADGHSDAGVTDSDGILHDAIPKQPTAITVTYQPANEKTPLVLSATVFPPEEEEEDKVFVERMRNVGFGTESDSDAFVIRQFQGAHKKLKRTGKLDDDTKQAVRDMMDEPLKSQFDDTDDTGESS